MNFHILTLFPDMVMHGLSESIIGRAAEKGLLSIEAVNIRDYTKDKHKKVDDYPYGGGAGMLMQAQPVFDAWQAVNERISPSAEPAQRKRVRTIYVTPQGDTFNQQMAKEFAKEEDIIFLCGHYEGIDERVLEEIVTDYVSIGDYVLTGGELPAMVMIDAISRMVPGVLSNDVSKATESFEGNLLEYPQYSRPEEWQGKRVPQILLSGNQKNIDAWRREESVRRTRERRPDMYERYEVLQQCYRQLLQQKLLHIDMTELIHRGQARLLHANEDTICLQDIPSGIYFHTAGDVAGGINGLKVIQTKLRSERTARKTTYLVLHQEDMLQEAEKILGAKLLMECHQAVYTRKEKLPIRGLYTVETEHLKEKPFGSACTAETEQLEKVPVIRRLEKKHLDIVCANYALMDDPAYMEGRIENGAMFGAFLEDELTGFIGMHTEGSIGMLEVLPQYRGQKIGKALEIYMINYCLEHGMTPYGQVVCGNEKSENLQGSLGLYFSKTKMYWLSV
jgi:tRNA (guanine37-N1)-methyltransferase